MHSTNQSADLQRELFRHTLATLAYRGGKAIRNAPEGFGEFNPGHGLRTPGEILAHIGDLFDWALSIARGQQKWNNSKPLPWNQECARFFAALQKLDDYVVSGDLHDTLQRLFQGPVADALTHIGQIALLRRLAGAPIKGENYHKASIQAGHVGADQATPKLEF